MSEHTPCVAGQVGKYGRIQVDDNFRTDNPRIFAIGDVIGPPGDVSHNMSQKDDDVMVMKW